MSLFFNRVFSVFQNPDQNPTRTASREPTVTIPPVPTVCITPPPAAHPYEVMRVSQRVLSQLRNSKGQFTPRTAATMLQQTILTPEGSPSGTLSSLPPSSTESSPSSITFSDKPFSDGTPATSPAPTQPEPVLPPCNHPNMTTDHKGSLQWEGDTDSSLAPGQFLREIDNKIDERGHTTDRQKIQCLKNNIVFGSDANEWFKKLEPNKRDTYEHLTEAFKEQWPLTTAPKKSKTEHIQALKEWVLQPNELAKKVEGPGGQPGVVACQMGIGVSVEGS